MSGLDGGEDRRQVFDHNGIFTQEFEYEVLEIAHMNAVTVSDLEAAEQRAERAASTDATCYECGDIGCDCDGLPCPNCNEFTLDCLCVELESF